LARDFAIASLVNDTVQLYWRCLASDQVARNSMVFDQRSADYEASLAKLAAKGLLEPTVAQRAKAMAVSRHVALEQAQNAAQDCRRELASATGAASGEAAALPGALPAMEPLAGTLGILQEDALVSLALQNRADYKAAGENVAAAAAKLDGARDSTAPNLNLAIEPDRAIVRFSQSIQNNVGEGLAEEAVAASSQAKIAQSQLQTQIRQQVSVTLRNLEAAYADWKVLNEAAQQMDVVVIDAGGRANLGIIDRSDFINTQSQLADIKNQAVNAQLQFVSSLATLRLMTGTIDPVTEAPAALAEKFLSPAIHD
jgi:outer membrane protein TolC